MKSFFTKLGGLLLCGVMFTAVGCHDYAEDIKDVNDRLDKIDGVLSGDSEGVAKDLAALKATVAALDATYATEAELEKAVGDLQTAIEGKVSAAVKEANDAVAALQAAVAEKADKSELTAKETELLAKINELKSDMDLAKSEMQNALAGLDQKYVALATYNAAISEINATLEGLDEIYFTKEAFNTAKANFEEAVKAINTKIAGVEGSIETLEEALESKVGIEEVNAAVETAVKVVADKVATLETTVDDVNTTLGELETSIKENADAIAEVKGDLATEVGELEAAIALKADKTAVDGLSTALDNLETELKGLVAAKADTAALSNLEATLSALINEKASQSALEEVEGAVKTLQGTVDSLATSNAEAHKALQAYAEEVKKLMSAEIDNLQNTIGKLDWRLTELEKAFAALAGNSKVSEAEIAQLFARIQSVVFRPEYADGNARVSYAAIGANNDVALEGYSEITYKVYPANCAQTIADAINAKENPVLTASFDAIKVKSETIDASLDVVSATADADGCLTITFDANLGEEFYAGEQKYAAALVLAETREDNPQIFSTEYTTFVKADPVVWEMALYVGNTAYAEYIKVPENASYTDVTWPFVAVGKEYQKEILPGVTPKFVATIDNKTVVKTPEEFAALGYDAAYTVATTVEYPDSSLPEQVISVGTYEDEAMASLVPTLVNKANVDDPNAQATVKKTFVWTVSEEDAVAEAYLDVVEFPYVLKVNSPAHGKTYPIEYTEDDEIAVVLGGEDAVELVFVNKNDKTDVVPAEDMIADYPVIEIESAYGVFKNWKSFAFTPASEEYPYPVSVKLAENVTFENVMDYVRIEYSFTAPLLEVPAAETKAYVQIMPETHEFTLTADTRNWNYKEDASVDAAIMNKAQEGNKYIYSNEVTVAEGGETDDVKLSDLLATAKYYIGEITKESVPVEGIKFSKAADAENVKVEFTGFDWGQNYNITAYSELPSGKTKTDENGYTVSIPAAVVYVYFDLTTVDRNREPVTYTAKKAVEIPFAKDLKTPAATEEPLPLAGLYANLVDGLNLNADANAEATYLENATFVSNTIKWGENKSQSQTEDKWSSRIITDNDLLKANSYNVGYMVNSILVEDGYVVKEFSYVKTMKTWYGQEVSIIQPVKLIDPVYDFAAVPQYIKGEENAYYINVLANYKFDKDGDVTAFSTEAVQLNGAFDVVDAEGNVINDKLADLGLYREYQMINNTDAGVQFADAAKTVINYNGKVDAVNVNGVLCIKNSNGTVYPITETIFSGAYKSFEVRKYDPLAETMTVLDGKAEQNIQITEAKKYYFAVLDNYSLLDVKGNEVINNKNVVDAKNDFVKTYATPEVYDLKPSYTMETYINGVKQTVPPTGITLKDGIITVDNTAQIQFANPVVIKVTATITYPQGERVGQTVTYTFN